MRSTISIFVAFVTVATMLAATAALPMPNHLPGHQDATSSSQTAIPGTGQDPTSDDSTTNPGTSLGPPVHHGGYHQKGHEEADHGPKDDPTGPGRDGKPLTKEQKKTLEEQVEKQQIFEDRQGVPKLHEDKHGGIQQPKSGDC